MAVMLFAPLLALAIATHFDRGDLVGDDGGPPAPDGSTKVLSGYAWAPNIGWISFGNNGQQGPSYNVYLQSSTDNLVRYLGGPTTGSVGYAWNPGIGWIKFDPNFASAADFPPNSDNHYGARVDVSGGTGIGPVSGWARACLVYVSGCSGTKRDDVGGWDGWIKFAGQTDPPSGSGYWPAIDSVSNPTKFLSAGGWPPTPYAWGGNIVGWISFCGSDYCVKIGRLNASCEVIGKSSTTGEVTVSDGQTVTWHGVLTGGRSPFSYNWSGFTVGGEQMLDGTTNTFFDATSGPYNCPGTALVNTDEQGYFFATDADYANNNNYYGSCSATAQVICDPGVVCTENCDGGGGAGGFLTEPTPKVIRINSQPLTSPAISSETTFQNNFPDSVPLAVAIKSTKSLVNPNVALTDFPAVKCRLATTAVSDAIRTTDPTFGSCDVNHSLDLAPQSAALAHFNIMVSTSTPLLNQNSPYELVVGSSTCPNHPAASEACYFVVKSFIFDYAATTINQI